MTDNKQTTAVEYYSKEIGRLTSDLITGKITGKQFVMLEIQLLEQAKEMEEVQMKLIYQGLLQNVGTPIKQSDLPTFEQYYKQTYGGKQ